MAENNKISAFESHMSINEAMKLKIKDKIDHRDQVGRFVLATIVEKQCDKLKLHYDGWSRKWDAWSDYTQELYRFAKAESISKRKAHRLTNLKVGSMVFLNPKQRHPQINWCHAEIRRMDRDSGQVMF